MPFLDYLEDPIVILGRDGILAEANRAYLSVSGLKRGNVLGMDCRDLEPFSGLWNTITRSQLEGKPHSERIRYKGRIYETSITPIREGEDLNHTCIVMHDSTAHIKLEEVMQLKNQELLVANAITSTFISSMDIEGVFKDLLEKVRAVTDMPMGWILLSSNDASKMYLKSMGGVPDSLKETLAEPEYLELYRKALTTPEPLVVYEQGDLAGHETLVAEGVGLMVLIPMRYEGRAEGVLALATRARTDLDFKQASIFSLIGHNLSIIVERVRMLYEMKRLATTDPLTGLYNIRRFYELLDAEIERSLRYGDPFSLILFDLDNFKSVNDTHGHQKGDQVLEAVSRALMQGSRKPDPVARYGGEEFILLLPKTGKEQAMRLAGRLKLAAEQAAPDNLEPCKVTLSGGVASYPDDAQSARDLMNAADMAMYRAKKAGKDRILAFEMNAPGGADWKEEGQ